jgi:hypothetical protein
MPCKVGTISPITNFFTINLKKQLEKANIIVNIVIVDNYYQ